MHISELPHGPSALAESPGIDCTSHEEESRFGTGQGLREKVERVAMEALKEKGPFVIDCAKFGLAQVISEAGVTTQAFDQSGACIEPRKIEKISEGFQRNEEAFDLLANHLLTLAGRKGRNVDSLEVYIPQPKGSGCKIIWFKLQDRQVKMVSSNVSRLSPGALCLIDPRKEFSVEGTKLLV